MEPIGKKSKIGEPIGKKSKNGPGGKGKKRVEEKDNSNDKKEE
jgi:hypothetical protein